MLNPKELEILNILWGTDQALTCDDIVKRGGGLSQSTVLYVLRKLLNEGLIECTGKAYSGNVLSRIYIPTAKAKVAVLTHIEEQVEVVKNVVSTDDIMSWLIDRAILEV